MYNTPMKAICIMKDCGRSVHVRGLCFNCYTTFRFHVNKGTITDQQAVELGLVLQSRCRSTSSPFAIKLRALFPNKMPS